ncbi:MAG TPA: M1 family metallopeptidase [Kofleriaceae bacterium]|nr:M1 family metallopeptidase [Kofleriaceae bacterium]
MIAAPARHGAAGLAFLALLGVACGPPRPSSRVASVTETAPPAPEVAVAAPPAHRLGDAARPRAYRLEVELDPSRERFAGAVEIELELVEAASSVWLHADGLTMRRASLERAGGSDTIELTRLDAPAGRGLLGLDFGRTLPAGIATLRIEYTGAMRERDGLFRQQYGLHWYAFTDFEPIDARRAFPCFDDPRFKTPFTLSLVVPADSRAFSNTEEVAEEALDGGRKRVRFATTPRLPSYLLAWAVGRFAVVDGPRAPIPIRAITFPGTEAEVALALETAAALLPLAQAYLDRPIPFSKLDLIAVPAFDGAMENPGLVTVSARILHVRADDPPPRAARLLAMVIAHEIAHYWFGDLVTMAWWDDLWLNEGFATWLSGKLVDAWKPAWRWPLEERRLLSTALTADRAPDARAMRQPVTDDAAIRSRFDAISYLKGGAVLGMLEHWLGPEVFRTGIRAYLDAHAWGSADAGDLATALGAASKQPVARVLRDFTERPGAPVLEAEARCTGGAGELVLRQHAAQPWRVPVCARIDARAAPVCTLLETRETTVPIGPCATFAHPNYDERSYALARRFGSAAGLSPIERLGALDTMRADAGARAASAPALIQALLELGSPGSPSEAGMAAELVRDLHRLAVLDERELEAVVQGVFGARARALGVQRRAGEPEADRLIRDAIIELAGIQGRDQSLRRQAAKQVARWLRTGAGLDPDLVDDVIPVAAAGGDAALFQQLVDALPRETERARRTAITIGLAHFESPALIDRALELARSTRISRSEGTLLLYLLLRAPRARDRAWRYLDQHRLELDRLGRIIPQLFADGCTADALAIADRILTPGARRGEDGGAVLAAIRACQRLRW